MAVRTINFTVSAGGISPAVLQDAGVQGDHNSTEVSFAIDDSLYQSVMSQAEECGGTAIYRIDGYDSAGGVYNSDTQILSAQNILYPVGEFLTRYGGNIKIVLVISLHKNDTTEMELFSFPALLKLKNLPEAKKLENEKNYQSLSTLSQSAKDAAQRAEQAAEDAENLKNLTEAASFAIQNGATVIFDGNGTFGSIEPTFTVDAGLSKSSGNAVANSAITERFNAVDGDLEEIGSSISSINNDIDGIKASMGTVGDMPLADRGYIVESGTADVTLYGTVGTVGTWYYTKYSNGLAECFANFDVSLNQNGSNTWGNVYTLDTVYPENLFRYNAENSLWPLIMYNIRVGNQHTLSSHYSFDTSEHFVRLSSISGYSGQQSCKVNIFLKGLWKNFQQIGGNTDV